MPPKPRDIRERFWEKISIRGDDECWLWGASLDAYGYGQFGFATPTGWTMVKAHRLSYELLVDQIPLGYSIDHLCRVRSCVNPSHLEPVTWKENLRRGDGHPGRNARKTHCVHGHEFTAENTRITVDGNRSCRACTTIRSKRRTLAKRSAQQMEFDKLKEMR